MTTPGLDPCVEVGASEIAGRGLFATAELTVGAAVLRREPDSVDHGANHSCSPNLGWADERTLVALRDISAGEELTYDYSTARADPSFLLRCHCETYRCRQMVTGDDWRIAELQRRYAGRWTPAVQRLIDAAR